MADSTKPFTIMFSGSPLNRLAWLRPSHYFLNAIITVPNTKWVLFSSGQPLVKSKIQSKPLLSFVSTSQIQHLLGPLPYFGQGQQLNTIVPDDINSVRNSVTEAARHYNNSIPIVFLGIHEHGQASVDVNAAVPASEFTSTESAQEAIKKLEDGTPYFALDIGDLVTSGQVSEKELLDKFNQDGGEGEGVYEWSEPRSLITTLDEFTGAIFSIARSLTDWNYRNKYCPGCGSKNYSMWGGWKSSCSSLLPWVDNTGKTPCPSGKGLHNYTHPRTDPVVIMIAIDETGNKILLGRGKRYPGKFYSAFAGFIEPGESFENAVSREMWEEAGIRVWDIRYHSGQPWPYPANLMVGFYTRADSTQPIRTDLDNELEDARWFTREEVIAALNPSSGATLTRADFKKIGDKIDGNKDNSTEDSDWHKGMELVEEAPFKLPPITAIAGVLIRNWAAGKIGFGSKGNGVDVEVVQQSTMVPNL